MRNLKRVLALALALVMMLGMMITASAASYTDSAAIDEDYEVAVEVLTGMGVFKGQSTASKVFAPKAILTRAEAATLIYRVITGDVTDDKIDLYDYASFADTTEGAWYNGYVTYAANGGYIKGYAGNFMPNDYVTGIQVLAIMLRAMGYGQNGEFEGAAWKDNVLTTADDLKILENVTANDLDKPASRELVAQLLFDAIQAPTTAYTPALGYWPKNLDSLGLQEFGLTSDSDEDIWGRPATVWFCDTNEDEDYDKLATGKMKETVYAYIAKDPIATYVVAVSDCQLATDLGMTKYSDETVEYWDNGYETTTEVDLYGMAKDNGGQGVQIEVYKDRIVRIDTYLAKVGDYHKAVVDAGGHVKYEAYNDVTVYDKSGCCAVVETTMEDTSYTKNDMILVNVNYTEGVIPVQVAETIVGAQTAHFVNSAKHEIEETIYDDAKHLHENPAENLSGDWTWYLDQFGNIIGNSKIVDPSAYGVIKSIQWINPEDEDGYAKAYIVDMTGETSVMTVVSIDGCNTDYIYGGAHIDWDGETAYVSDNLSDNFNTYAGQHLYEIKTIKGGVALTHVATVAADETVTHNEIFDAEVETGIPVISGDNDQILVDNTTMYLVRVDKKVNGNIIAHSYEAVTGYENIADYTQEGTIVDYVHLDKDGIADYVYIIGDKDAAYAVDFIYITSKTNIKIALATKGGDDYYVITNVIRGDGTTDALYIKDTDDIDRDDVIAWVEDSVGKLFMVASYDNYVEDLTTEVIEVVGMEEFRDIYAGYSGAVTVIGDGMIDTSDWGAWNTNKSTTYVNKNGVMEASDLEVGDLVYVIGEFKGDYYHADIIFVTDNDVAANTLAAAQDAAIEALNDYAAATVGSTWMTNNYPDAVVTVADIQDTLDELIAAVEAAESVDEVDAAMVGYQVTLDDAAKAVAAEKQDAADEAAASVEVATAEALADAIADEDVTTIKLTANVTLEEALTVAKDLTLDLNGKKIISEGTAIKATTGTLTITGNGTVVAGEGDSYVAVWAAGDADVVIENGTFYVGADENGEGNTCVYNQGSGTVTIKGGTFETEAQYAGKYWVLNLQDGVAGEIVVTGGTFVGQNPGATSSEPDGGVDCVPVGYKVVAEDGVYTVVEI